MQQDSLKDTTTAASATALPIAAVLPADSALPVSPLLADIVLPDSVLPAAGALPDSLLPAAGALPDSLLRRGVRGEAAALPSDSTRRDSVATADSVAPRKPGIDAPVKYEAKDSMIYEAGTGFAYLYGEARVNYQDMELDAARLSMCLDSSMVHADGRRDTTGVLQGKPVYKQGADEYESESMSFNFKTKKGFISNVSTTQGNGFLVSEQSKRTDDGTLYLQHARYTTCDAKHPHFYVKLSRAKVRPGKESIFGPAYLVVADVPLPLAIPYGFIPINKKYSSGFIMPTYGDETIRGFYLRDGGYYFALSDYMDLKVLGEIYTKGSWGLSGETNYRKRYRYNGNFYVSYIRTV